MSDKPYNLKVRVNMAPDEIVKPKEPEPQYLWGRIVLALLVLLVLFWGAFKLVSWLLAPAEPVTTAGVDPGSNGANVETGLLPGRSPAGEATAPTAMPEESPAGAIAPDAGGGASVFESEDPAEPREIVAVPEITEQEIAEQAFSEPEIAESEPVAESGTDAREQAEPEPAEMAAEEVPPTATARGSLLTPGDGDIRSPRVERFVLTNGVENREPLAGIEAIRPDPGNSDMVTVYAFSEVSGLRGQTLRYRWLHNGKAVATVKVGVGGNSWRSYSSKFVTSAMTGNWRVELLGGDNQVLAFREFEY
jgi:hypothetical protein